MDFTTNRTHETWFEFDEPIRLGEFLERLMDHERKVFVPGLVLHLEDAPDIIIGHATPYMKDTTNDGCIGWMWTDNRLLKAVSHPFMTDAIEQQAYFDVLRERFNVIA